MCVDAQAPPLFFLKSACASPLQLKIHGSNLDIGLFGEGVRIPQRAITEPMYRFEGGEMGCALESHLRLTNSRFYVLCVRMNNFKMHLMVSSRKVDSKVLRMAIK